MNAEITTPIHRTACGDYPAELSAAKHLAVGVWPVVRTQGWALLPFRGDKAHYFQRGAETAEGGRFVYSNCGMRGAETYEVPLLVPGNFPRCMRCAQSLPHAKRFS